MSSPKQFRTSGQRRHEYEDLDAAPATANSQHPPEGPTTDRLAKQGNFLSISTDTGLHLTPSRLRPANGAAGDDNRDLGVNVDIGGSINLPTPAGSSNIKGTTAKPGSCGVHQSALSLNSELSAATRLLQPLSTLQRDHHHSCISSLTPSNTSSKAHFLPATNDDRQARSHQYCHIKARTCQTKERVWLAGYACLYVGFLVMGGICFFTIEAPVEIELRSTLSQIRDNFLTKHPEVKDEDLEEFLRAVITANDRGISPLRNDSNDMNWSFGQALFFSSTVITTIGYGRVTPLSQTGKIFCMIYAAIGIPLTLVLLSAMVDRLLTPASWLLGVLNSKLGHLYQPFNIRLLHLSIVVILVTILFFAIPTAIFAALEPTWGALDAFYYCFISLTTIGLGDYIPGEGVSDENRSLYKMCITAYLICGLIAMMLVLTIFYDIPQLNLGQLFTDSVNSETEKLRLSGNSNTCYSGPAGLYLPQRDDETRRSVVRIRPHGDDSPSPDEAPTTSLNCNVP